MERLVGYEYAVIADAAVDGWAPGTVWSGEPAELARVAAQHLDSAHDVTLARAMEMATTWARSCQTTSRSSRSASRRPSLR